jgi:hypothetical protein
VADRYQVLHVTECRERKLPGYEDEPSAWEQYDSYWVLWDCDLQGNPIREVFADKMEPEDAILVRDIRPLVDELNTLVRQHQPEYGTL